VPLPLGTKPFSVKISNNINNKVLLYACILRPPENGDLSPKHVKQVTGIDGVGFYINCEYFLRFVGH
jgi:hypothetical protein